MRHAASALLLVCLFAVSAQAQSASSWGVAAAFVPKWDTSGAAEDLTKRVIDERYLGLSGSEFRIGIVRGRRLSGDWGVSFVQRMVDDTDAETVNDGTSCQGGSTGPGRPVVLACELDESELTPADLQIKGVEVHKFFAFVTISERVQIGLNIAGGIGQGSGSFNARTFRSTFTCTFPPGTFPDFDPERDPCTGGVKSNQTRVQTGTGSEPFERLLAYDKNMIPLGKLEVAAAVIVAPQFKVRVSGGLNYPGQSTFGVTGLFFFGGN